VKAPQFTLISRVGCELCDEMLAELQTFCGADGGQIEVLDVDTTPGLHGRYGHKVPVLMLDGLPVCHGRFDPEEVRRLLRDR
jgi:hypothetical protein